MNTISMELHQEQITELLCQIEVNIDYPEYEDIEDKCKSYEKANQSVLSIYNENLETTKALQELNSELVESCKKADRDFFILAAAYAATLMLMIYLFIR